MAANAHPGIPVPLQVPPAPIQGGYTPPGPPIKQQAHTPPPPPTDNTVDVVIKSLDGWCFYWHHRVLEVQSRDFLDNLERLAYSCQSGAHSIPVYEIAEKKEVIELLQDCIYPRHVSVRPDSVDILVACLYAARRYRMYGVIRQLRSCLLKQRFLSRNPLDILRVARALHLDTEAKAAFETTLEWNERRLNRLRRINDAGFDPLLKKLLKLRHRRARNMHQRLDDHITGNDRGTFPMQHCPQCSDTQQWIYLWAKACQSILRLHPRTSTIFSAATLADARRKYHRTCPCGLALPAHQDDTLFSIKAVLDAEFPPLTINDL